MRGDDVFHDPARHRLYVICGDGNGNVINQIDADTYEMSARIAMASGARTGFFVPS